jgi:hypothetical protein
LGSQVPQETDQERERERERKKEGKGDGGRRERRACGVVWERIGKGRRMGERRRDKER